MKPKKKVGLFFGSFNPVHIGHCIIADHVAQSGLVDEVWLVLTPQNPLKPKKSLLADHHRLSLLRLAIDDNSRLKVCDIEFNLPAPHYTIHTLVHLEEKYPNCLFSLIVGTDNLASFHLWKNYEVILENYQLIVFQRPGFSGGDLMNHKHVSLLPDTPLMQISSTFIRNQIKAKKDVLYLLPQPVYNYLKEMHFYEK
jgi:nicotinate-nucleotide adenylyltransferase